MERQPTKLTGEQKFKFIAYPIIIAIIVWFFYFKESAPDKPGPLQAYTMSQQFVKQQLKSPESAKFTDAYSNAVKQIDDSTFSVHSFVDSQNSFGAMLRTTYSCEMVFHSNETVTCKNLSID